MKNFREKIGRKFFLECVWLGGGGKKINSRAQVFSPQNGEKTE